MHPGGNAPGGYAAPGGVGIMHPGAGAAEQNAPGGGAAEQNAPRGGKTTLFSDKIAFKSNDFQWESRKQYVQ